MEMYSTRLLLMELTIHCRAYSGLSSDREPLASENQE